MSGEAGGAVLYPPALQGGAEAFEALTAIGKEGPPAGILGSSRRRGLGGAVVAKEGPPAGMFPRNGWSNNRRNGAYDYYRDHTNPHGVLGCYAGRAVIRFGGHKGRDVTLDAGDVVIIPAGVAHCRQSGSGDFAVVGAYPGGAAPDLPPHEADPVLEPHKGFARC